MNKKQRISPNEINEYITEGYKVIDIREKSELMTLPKMKKATNIPMSGLMFNSDSLIPDKNEKIVLVCNSGGRSNTIRQKLESEGYTDIVDVNGGMQAVKKLEDIELDK